jgi:hypothetical protein
MSLVRLEVLSAGVPEKIGLDIGVAVRRFIILRVRVMVAIFGSGILSGVVDIHLVWDGGLDFLYLGLGVFRELPRRIVNFELRYFSWLWLVIHVPEGVGFHARMAQDVRSNAGRLIQPRELFYDRSIRSLRG